jgi:hypothetical protein
VPFPGVQTGFNYFSAVAPDGGSHIMAQLSSTEYESVDGTGVHLHSDPNNPSSLAFIDANGTKTFQTSGGQITSIEDSNGNQLMMGTSATTDTVGRMIPTPLGTKNGGTCPKKGNPDVLVDAKDALANAIINNAELDRPAKVAPATGTATTQDSQIMRDAATNRANGGADPVEGRTQYGTTHNPNLQSRSASNHLKGEAGRETVYEKFGPFKDSTSRRPTWIVIYNDPGH